MECSNDGQRSFLSLIILQPWRSGGLLRPACKCEPAAALYSALLFVWQRMGLRPSLSCPAIPCPDPAAPPKTPPSRIDSTRYRCFSHASPIPSLQGEQLFHSWPLTRTQQTRIRNNHCSKIMKRWTGRMTTVKPLPPADNP